MIFATADVRHDMWSYASMSAVKTVEKDIRTYPSKQIAPVALLWPSSHRYSGKGFTCES